MERQYETMGLTKVFDVMKITKLGHACLLIEEAGVKILIDPGVYSSGFEDLKDIQALLITHQHEDHMSPEIVTALAARNPGMAIYADEGSVALLMKDAPDVTITAVHSGESIEVAGVAVAVEGSTHATIHALIPQISNVGYRIADRFFYPGDNFTKPLLPVEILALPLGAPWLKVGEVIDYMLMVRPRVAIPVHDGVLAMPQMHQGILGRFTNDAEIELRIVGNGTSTEV